jgi:hypothetical protein
MKTYKLLILVFISTLIMAEVLLRIFYYEQLKTRFWPNIYIPDSNYVVRLRPNTESCLITPGINHKFRINNQGFLGPDFLKTKRDSIFRIIIVGNSPTTGFHMNSDNSFCIQLQKIFNVYGVKAEVINCGRMGGHRDIQNLDFIKNEIKSYNPNLILFEKNGGLFERRNFVFDYYKNYTLEYNPHDPLSRQESIDRIDKIEKAWYLTILYDMSYIVRFLCRKYIDIHNKSWWPDLMFQRYDPIEIYLYTYITKESKVFTQTYYYTFEKAIEKIKDTEYELKAINCHLILFNYYRYPKEVQNIYSENKISYMQLNLSDLFSMYPINSKLEGHFNELGNTLVAERIFSQLMMQKIIPERYYK